MPDVPETTPDAANDPAPPAEVDGDAEPLTISQTLAQLREKGVDSFLTEEKDEGDSATEGSDDDGVSGGDVPDDTGADGDGSEGGDAGGDAPVPDAAAGETDDTGTGDTEADADVQASDDTDADPEPVVVDIPGRREGETVQLEVSDPELAERLKQLANDGMRRKEFNTQAAALRDKGAEIKQFTDRLATDPAGLILEKATPETREMIVRDILLSDAALLSKVLDQFNEIDRDENARVAATAQMERDAAIRARDADRLATQNDVYQQSANEIMGAVEALIPEDASDDRVEAFMEDAIGFLEFKASKEGPDVVNPANIKNLLETRLRLHGITGSAPDVSDGSGDGATTPTTPKIVLKKATEAEATKAATEGENLKTRSGKSKSTVTAPAGGGAETTQFNPPKGQTIKERIAWLRKTHPTL
jgi:hypothetical protein